MQLAQGLIAKHVPIILGPSGPANCAALSHRSPRKTARARLLPTNAGHPPAGSYVFLTLFSAEDMMSVVVRCFRRLSYIIQTDAAGQDAESALRAALAEPENKSIELVSPERFAAGDLSVAAQMARIKAAQPDAMIAWAAGTNGGTLFPRVAGCRTQPSNRHVARKPQRGVFQTIRPAVAHQSLLRRRSVLRARRFDRPCHERGALATPATTVLAGVGAKPDQIEISAWDPGIILVEAVAQTRGQRVGRRIARVLSQSQGLGRSEWTLRFYGGAATWAGPKQHHHGALGSRSQRRLRGKQIRGGAARRALTISAADRRRFRR